MLECRGRSPQGGDTQLGGRKEKENFSLPCWRGPRSGPVLPLPPRLSHRFCHRVPPPAPSDRFGGDTLGLSVGMSCPQQHPRAGSSPGGSRLPKICARRGWGCSGKAPARPQRPASRPRAGIRNWVSGRAPKMIGIGELPLPGVSPGADPIRSVLFPLSWEGAAGGTGTPGTGTGPTWSFGDRGGRRDLGQRLGTRIEAGSPRVELGKDGKAGNAEPAGRKRGRGRKAAPAPGSAEKRRKSGGKARGHGGGGGRKPGPGQERSRCALSPRWDRNSPVPGSKRPSWAAGPGVPRASRTSGLAASWEIPKVGNGTLGTPLWWPWRWHCHRGVPGWGRTKGWNLLGFGSLHSPPFSTSSSDQREHSAQTALGPCRPHAQDVPAVSPPCPGCPRGVPSPEHREPPSPLLPARERSCSMFPAAAGENGSGSGGGTTGGRVHLAPASEPPSGPWSPQEPLRGARGAAGAVPAALSGFGGLGGKNSPGVVGAESGAVSGPGPAPGPDWDGDGNRDRNLDEDRDQSQDWDGDGDGDRDRDRDRDQDWNRDRQRAPGAPWRPRGPGGTKAGPGTPPSPPGPL
ncbi:collagen alpha-2(I) chain-like [Molothrus ater]|uniref:collagen alpha-2(I) chain-like n=1 Tax=Molothrus ater TaxID=84834 RepID=UPI0017499CB9|nr:collagen alpha-2(I) chain-like [Molothrus ater]